MRNNMSSFTLLWKHWFWITTTTKKAKAMQLPRWSIYVTVVLLCQAQIAPFATAAPVGVVDTISFKKFTLNEEAKGGIGIGLNEKPNLPVVAASSMISSSRKREMRIADALNTNASPEDAVGDVMDGHEDISRIFVTLPTTTSTSTSTTTEGTTSSMATAQTETGIQELPTEVQPIEGILKEANNKDEVESSSMPSKGGEPTMAKIIQISINTTSPQDSIALETDSDNGLLSIPGMSIEESALKVDGNENIQNLVLVREEDEDVPDLNANRSRKSKVLSDNQTGNKNLLTRSTIGEEAIEASNPEARLQPALGQNLNRSPNLLIQFTDNDKIELLNSQNHALTSDDLSQVRASNFGLISGISFSVLALFCVVSLVGAMMYRRRYINKPQTLSEPDSSGYIDDSIIRVSFY